MHIEDNDEFFVVNTEDIQEIEFDAIKFIDLIRLAKNTWVDGYTFDVDPLVIKDAVPMAPAKIVMRSMLSPEKNKPAVYRIWCAITVASVDYAVPIPVHVYVKDYEEHVFRWTVMEPANMLDLNRYIANVEEGEESMWSDLLD